MSASTRPVLQSAEFWLGLVAVLAVLGLVLHWKQSPQATPMGASPGPIIGAPEDAVRYVRSRGLSNGLYVVILDGESRVMGTASATPSAPGILDRVVRRGGTAFILVRARTYGVGVPDEMLARDLTAQSSRRGIDFLDHLVVDARGVVSVVDGEARDIA